MVAVAAEQPPQQSVLRKALLRLEKHAYRAVMKGFRPRAGTGRFGLVEALGYGAELDHWMRYAPVVECIATFVQSQRPGAQTTVLDVGGGPAGLASLLRDPRCFVIALDPQEAALGSNRARKVVGDGCRLPVADHSIDVVVSIDSLEHVASERRLAFLRELDRVARGFIIIHCPIDSGDQRFQGTRFDRMFQELHHRYFRCAEANTAEHLSCGLPTVELVRSVFPDVRIRGLQNGDVWLRYMIGGRRPWRRILNGLYYAWVLKRRDGEPPFHAALMVVERPDARRANAPAATAHDAAGRRSP